MNLRIYYLLFASVFISIFLVSCRKDSAASRVPYVYVNFALYPNSLDYIPVGGSVTVTGGNRGIVVYRMTQTDFMAYDRTCPYDPENFAAKVILESSGITVVDPVCGSKFVLTDGMPIAGPANSPLLPYKTFYDSGSEILYISNW